MPKWLHNQRQIPIIIYHTAHDAWYDKEKGENGTKEYTHTAHVRTATFIIIIYSLHVLFRLLLYPAHCTSPWQFPESVSV